MRCRLAAPHERIDRPLPAALRTVRSSPAERRCASGSGSQRPTLLLTLSSARTRSQLPSVVLVLAALYPSTPMAPSAPRRRRRKRTTGWPRRMSRRTAVRRVLNAPLQLVVLILEEPIVWLALASYALYRTGFALPAFAP